MAKTHPTSEKPKPFLRWAGGKRQILHELLDRLPPDIQTRVYREPFLGAGSLFFALTPAKAVLSDLNEHLINCYESIRNFPARVAAYLHKHARSNSERYYYKIRDIYNKNRHSSTAAQAARFIYLNKTCYNGIFRVNQKGLFNVPYGRQKSPYIPTVDHFRAVAFALKSAKISTAPFEKALQNANKGDFVYLDPPYPPLNGTSCFTHYTADKFSHEDQEILAAIVKDLDARGCLFMVSNANTPRIRALYKPFNKTPLSVTRFITCKSKRRKVSELVITNYEVL